MDFKEEDFGWRLTFDEGRIERIQIDFRLGLAITDKISTTTITIASLCYLKGAGTDVPLGPENTPSLSPILPLFNVRVKDGFIQKTGRLALNFEDGRFLDVQPDDAYESWEVNNPSMKLRLICMPGGKVAGISGWANVPGYPNAITPSQ